MQTFSSGNEGEVLFDHHMTVDQMRAQARIQVDLSGLFLYSVVADQVLFG